MITIYSRIRAHSHTVRRRTSTFGASTYVTWVTNTIQYNTIQYNTVICNARKVENSNLRRESEAPYVTCKLYANIPTMWRRTLADVVLASATFLLVFNSDEENDKQERRQRTRRRQRRFTILLYLSPQTANVSQVTPYITDHLESCSDFFSLE